MIEISVGCDRLEARGHADFARRGEDPVCAGVSALFWALAYGLREVAGAEARVETLPDGLRAAWTGPLGPEGAAIRSTIVGALGEIAGRHPAHVRVRQAEGVPLGA